MVNSRDPVLGAQMLAGAIARQLRLPQACIIVNFRDMKTPGRVELTSEDNYLVDLRDDYRSNQQDIAAILAHEATHIFLHRHGIRFHDNLENEILTDTAAVYLGVGWLRLNAHRVNIAKKERLVNSELREVLTTVTEESLGYLTPEEFGYVLRKRSIALGDLVDNYITSRAARAALAVGSALANADYRTAPTIKCAWWQRCEYAYNRWIAQRTRQSSLLRRRVSQHRGYRFDTSDSIRVIIECPVCFQNLRLPTRIRATARCCVCGEYIECST